MTLAVSRRSADSPRLGMRARFGWPLWAGGLNSGERRRFDPLRLGVATAAVRQMGFSHPARPSSANRLKCARGSVLVGLLWCFTLLSVVVISILHTSRTDLRIAKNHGDKVQAHYLALAGVEKAKALLFHDAASRRRAAQNHGGDLYDTPSQFREVALGRGTFSVFREKSAEEGGGKVFGISDEESRLNINSASGEELQKLRGLTPEISAAILDYRDEDNTAGPGGAEAEYYASVQPPYMPADAPFQTIRQMLMVRGVSVELLLGEDANGNGVLDPNENDGPESYPNDNRDGVLDTGWSQHFTVHSAAHNVNAAGDTRVNLKNADESTLSAIPGMPQGAARAIVGWRGQNQIESVFDLLDVRAMSSQPGAAPQQNPNSGGPPNIPGGGPRGRSGGFPGGQPGGGQAAPQQSAPQQQPTGPTLINQDSLIEIADDVTASDDETQNGVVNVNTAPVPVLECLPGMTRELAQAVVSYRQSAGFLASPAALLRVPGMTREIAKQLAPRITTRSETFRILSEGTVKSTGASKRMQMIVRVGASSVETIAYREDL